MHPLNERLKINILFNWNYISFQKIKFKKKLDTVSVINHYHIDGLHLFWDRFESFCFQIRSDTDYFSSLAQGIVITDSSCNSMLFSNLKEKKVHYIIISRVITSHIGPMCVETHCILNKPEYTLFLLIHTAFLFLYFFSFINFWVICRHFSYLSYR